MLSLEGGSKRKRPLSSRWATLWLSSALVALVLASWTSLVGGQLPEDIQRELNQNLEEQARIQAMRQQHQRQIGQRVAANGKQPAAATGTGSGGQTHDPNNYSFQQVSPPIQYSYYQPFGDAAPQQPQQQQPPVAASNTNNQAANFDLNSLNFDSPPASGGQSSGQQQPQLTPSFTGVGGLPVMKPLAAAQEVPMGQAPLAPQARVQQGPPLTEADFKDITGGENYGAPGGSDFGLGDAAGAQSNARSSPADNTDAQLREFGMPAAGVGQPQQQQSFGGGGSGGQQMGIPDFGAFNPLGGGGSQRPRQRAASNDMMGGFGNLDGGNMMMGGGSPSRSGTGTGTGNDFDEFAGQPSSAQRQDQAADTLQGGAPASLQSLLGAGFPGLGGAPTGSGRGGGADSGLDGFSSGSTDPQAQQQRAGDNSMDVADLGDRADQFSGANLGQFEQPAPSGDQDFNYAAASEQQPKSVPYSDGNPQPVGTLLALTQPQSLTQTRYSALPDKGTYQDYPAYASGEGAGPISDVTAVVDNTPRARPPAPGRYGTPSPDALAPEYRAHLARSSRQRRSQRSRPVDYGQQIRAPRISSRHSQRYEDLYL